MNGYRIKSGAYYTVKQAACISGMNPLTLYKRIERGQVHVLRIGCYILLDSVTVKRLKRNNESEAKAYVPTR